ncbi:MAG: chromate transporter [Treponema sp.]|nr:chromate transporter [Treponema sp.]
MARIKILVELFLSFFRIGAFTFGGGISMLPIIDRELCQKKGWISQDELVDYYAIGQVTPGIVAVNVATFCGHKQAGTLGGAVATLAVVTPSVIVISLLASSMGAVEQIPVIKKALAGVNVAVAANLSYSVIKFFKKSVVSLFGLALFALAFVLVFFFKFSAVLVIFSSALLGTLIYALYKKPKNAAASIDSGPSNPQNPQIPGSGQNLDAKEGQK